MKVLIVDDEMLAIQRLQKLLEKIEGFTCVDTAQDGGEALEKIRLVHPDIVLSDIRMPDMDGIELVKAAKEDNTIHSVFIFTTAYEEHALKAFDLQVSGYLLKPINQEKLLEALQRAAQLVVSNKQNNARQHLSASSRGKVTLIPIDDVRLLQAEHKYVTVYHTGGEALIDESLKNLEDEFPHYFFRVHRNALVAHKYVEALDKDEDGQYFITIQGIDIKPVVSRRLLADVRQWIKRL